MKNYTKLFILLSFIFLLVGVALAIISIQRSIKTTTDLNIAQFENKYIKKQATPLFVGISKNGVVGEESQTINVYYDDLSKEIIADTPIDHWCEYRIDDINFSSYYIEYSYYCFSKSGKPTKYYRYNFDTKTTTSMDGIKILVPYYIHEDYLANTITIKDYKHGKDGKEHANLIELSSKIGNLTYLGNNKIVGYDNTNSVPHIISIDLSSNKRVSKLSKPLSGIFPIDSIKYNGDWFILNGSKLIDPYHNPGLFMKLYDNNWHEIQISEALEGSFINNDLILLKKKNQDGYYYVLYNYKTSNEILLANDSINERFITEYDIKYPQIWSEGWYNNERLR